uniref:Uncharacterized protein n=1 Tax=Cyclophora tenuis TaxID=216820 RepID=A0A7S1GKH3_CYCTE|mmetsp:Transcript_15699/g.26597  ORF Transcript_15699/g.26597 Transcript_15699/m.26597 type:complete len:122 (+) Transcript_15699:263-628(+)
MGVITDVVVVVVVVRMRSKGMSEKETTILWDIAQNAKSGHRSHNSNMSSLSSSRARKTVQSKNKGTRTFLPRTRAHFDLLVVVVFFVVVIYLQILWILDTKITNAFSVPYQYVVESVPNQR